MQVSLWEKESFFAPQDIIIAGSGLMGLWTAYELKKRNPSLQITILEKNIIPLGASTRNAGFACYGSPSELLHDAELNGTDTMLPLVEMRYKGIEKIKRIFEGKDIGWNDCGGYEVFDDNSVLENVKEKLDWLNEQLNTFFPKKQTFTWVNDKMQAMNITGFSAMIENKDEAALHSGKLVQQLIQLVIASGISVLFNTEIKNWIEENGIVTIQTNHQTFTTKKLLFATNAFTKNICEDSKVKPGRGQVIVTSPIENLKLKGTFHYDEGFYYFRNVGNRILLGGARNSDFENETTTELITSDLIQNTLEQFISKHLLTDQAFTVEHRWSGIMGFTETKQPELKKLSSNVFTAIACNGMGVALSPVFAEKVASEIIE
jgi:gamma-glutamylputrescine oxidase